MTSSECYDVFNQWTVCTTACSGLQQRKHKGPHYWPLVGANRRLKGPAMRQMFPCLHITMPVVPQIIHHYNDVIMCAMASQITNLTIIYATVYSRRGSKKTSKLRPLAFVRGIHRWPVNSPHKGPVMRKLFPYDDVIMYPHHLRWIRYLVGISSTEITFVTRRWHKPCLKAMGVSKVSITFSSTNQHWIANIAEESP